MRSLRQVISTVPDGWALAHFNVSNLEMLRGVTQAAQSGRQPVIVGVSEGESEAIGVREIVALVNTIRQTNNLEIFLNADHVRNFDKAREAVLAGFDAVLADGSQLSWEENLKFTKEVVAVARASGRDVLIEGELGQIGTGSEVREEIPVDWRSTPLTTPEQAAEFVKLTGVDLLAPAVGNFHGMLRSGLDPDLNIDLIKQIATAAQVPLVLHGASGNTDADVRAAIEAGVKIVHVSTELRVAYRDALKLFLADNPDEVAPYKFSRPAIQAVQKVVEKKLKLFSSRG